MPYARNGSLDIWYEASGEGEPLVLLMGLGADHSVWRLHREAYERHFRCIAIDNRGVGRSSKPAGPYTTADMAGDALAVMDHAGVDSAAVAGISMGGAIAQELALSNAHRVHRLLLIATFAKLTTFNSTVFEHFKSIRHHCTPEDFMRCLQLWIWGEHYFDTHEAELATARTEASLNPNPQPHYAFNAQCAACIGHDTLSRLPALQMPVLVTAGDRDIFTPLPLATKITQLIAGSKLEIFKNGAHTHHWEHLERFNDLTLRFLMNK